MRREAYFDPERHPIPKGWDALSAAQLERCCLLLHRPMGARERMGGLMSALLSECMPKGTLAFAGEAEAMEATAFLLAGTKRTRPPRESLRLGLRRLEGPGARLSTCTFGEFILAEAAFSEWARKGSPERLDRLCAILYRPAKPIWERLSPDFDGDRRARLNSNMLAGRTRAFSKAGEGFRLAVAAYFAGSLGALAGAFPRLFRRAAQGEAQGRAVWMRAAARLADGLPNYDAILRTRLSLALFQLSEMAEEAERIKAIAKNTK